MEIRKRQKIGYVVKRYPRFSETFIVNEILAHEAAGLEVVIFALGSGMDERFQPSLADVKAPVIYIGSSSKRPDDLWEALRSVKKMLVNERVLLSCLNEAPKIVASACQLASLVAELEITHMHAHFATSATSVARLASIMTSIPYSFTAHAKDIFHESTDAENLDTMIRDADAVVTVSEYNINYLCNRFESAASKVIKINNGLPLTEFDFSESLSRPNKIVAVGRLVQKKGFADLIEACSILRSRDLIFTCDIVGSGELEVPLQNKIDQLGLSDIVTLRGSQPQQVVKHIVTEAAVFAAPCVVADDGNKDGLPTVLLEAMALGTACVATDVTGIPEIIHDRQTGCLVHQHDILALADSLQLLLDRQDLRAQYSRSARKLIEDNFDSSLTAAKLRNVFTSQEIFA